MAHIVDNLLRMPRQSVGYVMALLGLVLAAPISAEPGAKGAEPRPASDDGSGESFISIDTSRLVTARARSRPIKIFVLSNGFNALFFNQFELEAPASAIGSIIRQKQDDLARPKDIRITIGDFVTLGVARREPIVVGDVVDHATAIWLKDMPFDRPGIHAEAGPGGLPQDVVHFVLAPRRKGEKFYVLPMALSSRMGSAVMMGDEAVVVYWDLERAETLVTAAAAARIVKSARGHFEGASFPVTVAFKRKEPVRTLILHQPFQFGPMSIDRMQVLTSGFGDVNMIAESVPPVSGDAASAPTESAEKAPIIVTAPEKPGSDPLWITFGRDALKSCSSLTFDKPRKRVLLSCLPEASGVF